MENDKFYMALVKRHQVTRGEITTFVCEDIVKFVFFDENYYDITSDNTVKEIHKFKSKYRGNTYIRIPLKIVVGEKYVTGIEETNSEENADGFVVVSKHDLRELSTEMKKAKKDERIEYGLKLCRERLRKFNCLLRSEVYKIDIRDEKSKTVFSKNIITNDTNEINQEIEKEMNRLKGNTNDVLK